MTPEKETALLHDLRQLLGKMRQYEEERLVEEYAGDLEKALNKVREPRRHERWAHPDLGRVLVLQVFPDKADVLQVSTNDIVQVSLESLLTYLGEAVI